MRTRVLRTRAENPDPDVIREALDVLRHGGLIAFPTDTVYGLGSLAFVAEAVGKLYDAKGRSPEKAIPVLLARVEALSQVAVGLAAGVMRLAERFWPGPLTLVVPKHPDLPDAVSATATVGVRIPEHTLALALMAASGPLAVTSANLAGGRSHTRAEEVLADLGGRIDLLIDGGEAPGGMPSTVVDCTGPGPRILRMGPLAEDEVLSVWGRVEGKDDR